LKQADFAHFAENLLKLCYRPRTSAQDFEYSSAGVRYMWFVGAENEPVTAKRSTHRAQGRPVQASRVIIASAQIFACWAQTLLIAPIVTIYAVYENPRLPPKCDQTTRTSGYSSNTPVNTSLVAAMAVSLR
jgi:hypothetical protein